MRVLFAALMLCFVAFPAQAYWTTDAARGRAEVRVTQHGRVTHGHAARFARHIPAVSHQAWHSIGLGGDCATAARLGGPCGCVAMRMVGLTDRRLWAVSAWLGFPRTQPHVGAAAIWPGRHVEIVSAVNGDGTVSTKGSIGFSRVSASRLIFVEAH